MYEHVTRYTELSNHLKAKIPLFITQLHLVINFFFCFVNYKIQYDWGQKYQLLSIHLPSHQSDSPSNMSLTHCSKTFVLRFK